MIEEPKPHEPHSQDNLQASTDHLFQTTMEAKDLWTTFDGVHPLEPEIKKILTCVSPDILCTQETTHRKEDNLYGMEEEDIQHGLNKEMDQ